MTLSNASTSNLRTAIKQAVNHFAQDDDFMVVTDFHLHLDPDTGEVAIADDTEQAAFAASTMRYPSRSGTWNCVMTPRAGRHWKT